MLYNKATLKRLVNAEEISLGISGTLEKIYLETEKAFFDDENLFIYFEDFFKKMLDNGVTK